MTEVVEWLSSEQERSAILENTFSLVQITCEESRVGITCFDENNSRSFFTRECDLIQGFFEDLIDKSLHWEYGGAVSCKAVGNGAQVPGEVQNSFFAFVRVSSPSYGFSCQLSLIGLGVGELTVTQQTTLELLAKDLAGKIGDRFRIAELEKVQEISAKHKELYRRSSGLARLGGFYVSKEHRLLTWSPLSNSLLGLEEDFTLDYSQFEKGEWPESLNQILRVLRVLFNPGDTHMQRFEHGFHLSELDRHIQVVSEYNASEMFVVFSDQTQNVQVSRDLRNYKTIMAEVEKLDKMGGFSHHLETNRVFWTPNTYRIFEIAPEELEEYLDKRLASPDGRNPDIHQAYADSIKTQKPFFKEYEHTLHNGKKKWLRIAGQPILEQGSVVKIIGSVQDISEQIEIKNKLIKSKERAMALMEDYRMLLNNGEFFVIKLDEEFRLTFVNQAFDTKFSANGNGLIGTSCFNFIDPGFHEFIRKKLVAAFKYPDRKYRALVKKTLPSGQELCFAWDIQRIESNLQELVCVGFDVSDLEEKRLQIQKLSDLSAVQYKRNMEMNAIVSHNIRSYLANSLGLASLMEFSDNKEEEQQYFSLMKKELLKADETIFELYKLNSVEDFDNTLQPVPLKKLAQDCFTLSRKSNPTVECSFVNRVEDDLLLISSKKKLENILLILFANALSYRSSKRKLEIVVSAYQAGPDSLKVRVSDNGVGLAPEKQGDKLFRLNSNAHRVSGKKGMGLYLAKCQVESLGGQIELASQLDSGTQVTLKLTNHEA